MSLNDTIQNVYKFNEIGPQAPMKMEYSITTLVSRSKGHGVILDRDI